jgi:hypothetical protein
MRDIASPTWLYVKGGLFLVCGLLASALLLAESPTFQTAVLLVIAIWSFCRLYYFAFYVIEHYVDPGYKFAGLTDFARYVVRRRPGTMPPEALVLGENPMVVKIQDQNAIAAMESAKSPLDVQTADGRHLGRFIPADPTGRMNFPEFGMTDEELERRENDPNVRWYTADEVMDRLRSLRKSS